MTLYMEVTADKYELPLAVAGSGAELARMINVSCHSIYNQMSFQKIKPESCGRRRHGKYIKVEVEDDEDET